MSKQYLIALALPVNTNTVYAEHNQIDKLIGCSFYRVDMHMECVVSLSGLRVFYQELECSGSVDQVVIRPDIIEIGNRGYSPNRIDRTKFEKLLSDLKSNELLISVVSCCYKGQNPRIKYYHNHEEGRGDNVIKNDIHHDIVAHPIEAQVFLNEWSTSHNLFIGVNTYRAILNDKYNTNTRRLMVKCVELLPHLQPDVHRVCIKALSVMVGDVEYTLTEVGNHAFATVLANLPEDQLLFRCEKSFKLGSTTSFKYYYRSANGQTTTVPVQESNVTTEDNPIPSHPIYIKASYEGGHSFMQFNNDLSLAPLVGQTREFYKVKANEGFKKIRKQDLELIYVGDNRDKDLKLIRCNEMRYYKFEELTYDNVGSLSDEDLVIAYYGGQNAKYYYNPKEVKKSLYY